jgi:alginate O-acetyltransferase complex protein AlgI
MQFNSAEFLFFFPTVLLLYFALPHRWRWVLLLGASYTFYNASLLR